jgi:hypothetical protein
MSTSSCQTCIGNVNDLTGMAQLKKIERMISDNYTIIFISFILIILLGLMLWYFSSQLTETLKEYYKAVGKRNAGVVSKTPPAKEDLEDYDDEQTYVDTTTFFEPGKADFVTKMTNAYKEYNEGKTEYIRTTYGEEDGDNVDTTALYSKYDKYNYKKEDN